MSITRDLREIAAQPLPTRAQYRRHRPGCTLATYRENTRDAYARLLAFADRVDAAAVGIRAMLPTTEAQVMYLDTRHGVSETRTALGRMIGSRCGAVTTGELVIVGYTAGGAEIYGAR